MFAKWDLKVLKDPKGYFKTSEVHVLTSKDLEQQAPDVYHFLQNWSIPVKDVEKMILEIEDGANATDVAKQWIKDHQDKVDQMVKTK